MNTLTGNDIKDMYTDLGISLDTLGCIMLSIDGSSIPPFKNQDNLYTSPDPVKFWIRGFVSGNTPHITLLYGLIKSGDVYKKYVDQVLSGWKLDTITIKEVGFFDSPYPDEPYYCIVAHVDITPELQQMHERLQLLPHVDSNPGYKAHITIAYIKKDPQIRDNVIDYYNMTLKNKTLKVLGLNYGDKKDIGKSMYCVSCRSNKDPKEVEEVTLTGNRLALRSQCPDCKSPIFRFK